MNVFFGRLKASDFQFQIVDGELIAVAALPYQLANRLLVSPLCHINNKKIEGQCITPTE